MSATLAEIEELFAETIVRVADMDGTLRGVMTTQATMAKAHSDIGNAFTMLAKTFERVELRQEQLEKNNIELYKDKGIPPRIFFIVTMTLAIVIVLGAVWITDTFIKASFTSFEAGRQEDYKKLQSSLTETKEQIIEEVKDGSQKR